MTGKQIEDAAVTRSKPKRRAPPKNFFRWLAIQARECSVAVVALGGLLVAVQLAFPTVPQHLLDRLVLLLDNMLPAQASEAVADVQQPANEEIQEETKRKVLEDAGLTPTKDVDASQAQGGPLVPALASTFFPAFVDGYVYYEVSTTGTITKHGRLGFEDQTKSIPDFISLPKDQVLRAYGLVRVRADPAASARKIDTLRIGECVTLIEKPLKANAIATKVARSGGWLHVRHADCSEATARS